MLISYQQFEYGLCAAVLVLSMGGMGATLRLSEFVRVAKAPHGVLLILLAQIVLAPSLALGLGWALRLPDGVALGLLIVSALPGGAFSNLLTFLGRGNVPLSISATGLCTLGSLVTTTTVLRVFAASRLPADVEMPVLQIIAEVGLLLLAPLAAGMLLHRAAPRRAARASRLLIQASMAVLAVFVVAALGSGRLRLTDYGWGTYLALILYFQGSLWMGYGLGLLNRMSMDDAFAIAIEVSVRNTALGLLLKASLFPADSAADPIGNSVLFVLLAYSGLSLTLSLAEVYAKLNHVGVLYRR